MFTAFTSLIRYVAEPDTILPAITYWLMGGGIASVAAGDVYVAIGPIGVGVLILMLLRWTLNVMAFGEEEARALGVNTTLIRSATILAATLVTSSAVAISGVVGLVGLVVPHIARAYVGPNFTVLLPASALLGALFVLLMDNLARSLFSVELPLGILTEIVGAPFFLFLLSRAGRHWA